jgi:Icc-related predicted phosphoesterase
MNIIAIADDDSMIGALDCGTVDVLISCGDLYDAAIQRAVARYRPRKVFAVRGNHDPDTPFPDGIADLHLSRHTFEGVRFGGFGGSWRYKPRGHHLFEQMEVSGMMRGFPQVDIFVAHNSPRGIHERDGDVHQGFDGFVSYLDRAGPRLFIHGHQHVDVTTVRNDTTILGVYGERVIRIDL